MKNIFFIGVTIIVIATIAAFNINLNIDNVDKLSVLSLANVEALSNESPDVEIVCDTNGSGRCYYVAVEEGLFGTCRFDCAYNGKTTNNCNRCFVLLINFCSAYAASCGG